MRSRRTVRSMSSSRRTASYCFKHSAASSRGVHDGALSPNRTCNHRPAKAKCRGCLPRIKGCAEVAGDAQKASQLWLAARQLPGMVNKHVKRLQMAACKCACHCASVASWSRRSSAAGTAALRAIDSRATSAAEGDGLQNRAAISGSLIAKEAGSVRMPSLRSSSPPPPSNCRPLTSPTSSATVVERAEQTAEFANFTRPWSPGKRKFRTSNPCLRWQWSANPRHRAVGDACPLHAFGCGEPLYQFREQANVDAISGRRSKPSATI